MQGISDPRVGRTLLSLAKVAIEAKVTASERSEPSRLESTCRDHLSVPLHVTEPVVSTPVQMIERLHENAMQLRAELDHAQVVLYLPMGCGKTLALLHLMALRHDSAKASDCWSYCGHVHRDKHADRADSGPEIAAELAAIGTVRVRENQWPLPGPAAAGAMCGLTGRVIAGTAKEVLAVSSHSPFSPCTLMVLARVICEAEEALLRLLKGVLAILRLLFVFLLAALSRTSNIVPFFLTMIAARQRYGRRYEPADDDSLLCFRHLPVGRV